MKLSICIPNYNYERFLGRTLDSVLSQDHGDLEVCIADNASTDGSVALVNARRDPRITCVVNPCNVGFAGNLDRAARLATGDAVIMLSSDDLMRPGALSTYARLLGGADGARTVITAAADIIDPEDQVTGRIGPDRELWRDQDLVATPPGLPAGTQVYRVEGTELLRRCLGTMKNPFNFLATCYPRSAYEKVGGYGGGRLINPDKWFHWKLLAGSNLTCLYVDSPLFAYRVHPNNQTALQAASGALKYLIDDYASVIELDGKSLEQAGIKREELERAFVERDIARHGLATLARGQSVKARRILGFGAAVYPSHSVRSPKAWALLGLLALGPVGQKVAARLYERDRHRR
jgi:glycosyltransferase involved in cell wall biosynthesis